MGLKPGYKLTEVGVIPEDWDVTSLSALVDQGRKITYGIVVPGPVAHNGVPMIRAQDYSNGWVDLEDLYRVSEGIDKAYKRSKVITGDVLLTIVGSVGNLAKVPCLFSGSNITQQSARLSFNQKVADANYYLNVLLSQVGRKEISNYTKSGVQPSLNLSDVEKFMLPHPTLPEQRAIAGALNNVDALIDALGKLIAKKRDLKQAAMQQLLTGKKRLPRFISQWEVKTIKEVVAIPVTDGPHLTPKFLSDGIPFLSVNNLIGNKINLNDLRFISRSDHELFSRKCRPERNDLLLGKAASVGKVALVEFDVEFNIWSPIALIRLNSQHSPKFFYYCFQSANVIRQITLFTNSSSQGNLGMGGIEKLEFPVPPFAEQTAIAEVLSDMDAELAALEQRLDKTRALKQGMMQELLTGRIRLV